MPNAVKPTAGATIDGARVRELREKRHLTREALAVQAGVAYSTVMSVEQGTAHNVRISTISAIAGVFGVSVDSLLTEAT